MKATIPKLLFVQPGTWTDHAPHDGHDYHVTIRDDFSETVAYTRNDDVDVACGTANRIAACYNACDGINPEAVPAMLKELKSLCNQLDMHVDWANENDPIRDEAEKVIDSAKRTIALAEGKP